jgi:hypothetical protein
MRWLRCAGCDALAACAAAGSSACRSLSCRHAHHLAAARASRIAPGTSEAQGWRSSTMPTEEDEERLRMHMSGDRQRVLFLHALPHKPPPLPTP